jgi:hypothetical protein
MWPHSILKETKDDTRIYVFIGQREMLVRFMKQMRVEQLFTKGKYMVVYLFPDTAVRVSGNKIIRKMADLEIGFRHLDILVLVWT